MHTAWRAGGDFLADHKTFSGMDADISPDGTWLAVMDGAKLVKVDIASGSRSTVTNTQNGHRVAAISPDGTWIVVQGSATFSGYMWVAYRVKDGAPVTLSLPQRMSYYLPERGRIWLAREGELPDPTPIPTRTAKPRSTPRRRGP